jgi:hypothetical protein
VYLARDALHHGVLYSQQVFELPVVTLGPEVRLSLFLDELNGDAHAVSPATNTALDKVVRVQLSTDLFRRQIAAFVFRNSTVGYYSESIPIELADLGNHFFSQAITEELLVGIATQVLEGQDSEHYLALGKCGRPRCSLPAPNRQEARDGEQSHCSNKKRLIVLPIFMTMSGSGRCRALCRAILMLLHHT